jgi:Zn-dependent protease
VTLDPMPHIRREPFGMVVVPIAALFLIGWPFGYAHAPYDPNWADRHPKRAAIMALAGPAANLLLLVLATAGLRAGLEGGLFEAPARIESFAGIAETSGSAVGRSFAIFLSLLFTQNLVLFLFNLIPLPPMDGSAAVGLFLPRDVNRRYMDTISQPMIAFGGIVIAWIVFPRIFPEAFWSSIDLVYAGITEYR